MTDLPEKNLLSVSEGFPRNVADFDPNRSSLWISLAQNELVVVRVTGLDEYLPGANVTFSLWAAISNPAKKESGGSDYDFTFGKSGGIRYIRDIEVPLKEESLYLQMEFLFPPNIINNQTEIFTGSAWKIIIGIVREDVKLVTVSSPQLPLRKMELYGNWFAVGFNCTNLTQPEPLLFTTFDIDNQILGEKNITLPVPILRMGKFIKRYGAFRLHEFLIMLKPGQGYCVVMDMPEDDYWVGVMPSNKGNGFESFLEYLKITWDRKKKESYEQVQEEIRKIKNSNVADPSLKSWEESLAKYSLFKKAMLELETKGTEDE